MSATVRLLAAALILAMLTACGGSSSDDGPRTTDVAQTFGVSTQQAAAITHEFSEAGTYTLTVTGSYAPVAPQAADSLDVWFSFSGQGSISTGDAEPAYAFVSGSAVVPVQQSITVQLTGAGPWQVTILCRSEAAAGTMSALTLTTAKN